MSGSKEWRSKNGYPGEEKDEGRRQTQNLFHAVGVQYTVPLYNHLLFTAYKIGVNPECQRSATRLPPPLPTGGPTSFPFASTKLKLESHTFPITPIHSTD